MNNIIHFKIINIIKLIMAYTSHFNNLAKQSARASAGGDSNILKTSAIIGIASGLISAGLYFLYRQYSAASSSQNN